MSHLSLAERLAATRRDQTLADILAASEWDHRVVMHAVLTYGTSQTTWTANNIRDLLPEQGRGFLGAAISGMRAGGLIRRVHGSEVPSTLATTKGHELKAWTLTVKGHRLARRYNTGVAA